MRRSACASSRRLTAAKEPLLDTSRLLENQAIDKLIGNLQLQALTIRRNQKWHGQPELDALRAAWRTEMKQDAELLSYLAAPAGNYQEDQEILKHLYKEYVFKGDGPARVHRGGRPELGGKPLGGEKPGGEDGEDARRSRR